MDKINCLIVDDEELARNLVENYINRLLHLNVVGKCANPFEAMQVLQEKKVDLMFLDIQMPQLTGIDFLKTLNKPPLVIFTTAYPNYAIEGFELDALDYLLKPISVDRFMKAANKAIDQVGLQQKDDAAGAPDQSTSAPKQDYFFVKADKKLVKVNFKEIIYIQGLKDYVIIRMDSSRVITLQTMKSLEQKLPSGQFMRIHRSYIVNVEKINAIIGNMVEVMEKNQAKHLPIGKNYREDLLTMINKNRL